MATMSRLMGRSFAQPDEQAEKGGVTIDVVYLGDIKVKRATYPQGWRFSKDMGADRCQDNHVGYVIKGRTTVRHDDGTEVELGPGKPYVIEPGHDAWVVGDEGVVAYEFESKAAEEYARS
jgi:uncharacterized cupin superfamily protein